MGQVEPPARDATGCRGAAEGKTGTGDTAALGAAGQGHSVGASEVRGRPEGNEVESGEDIADAAAFGGISLGSSAGPATRCSIQG